MINSHEMQQQQNVQQQHVQQQQQNQVQQQNQQQSQQNQQQQQQSSNQSQQQTSQQQDGHSQQVNQQIQPQQQMQQVSVQQQQQQQQQQSQQQNNGQHNVTQVQVQPQVAASMPQQLQNAVAVSMQHQQQQPGVSMALAGQQGATTITTMAAHPQAVQVIQQPMQSQAYHLQQLYNTQGTPLLMPGNLALHPAGLNPSSIQVITAGKPFQSAAQLTPHMLTTASTPGQPGSHGGPGGKVQGFPAGYVPVPTSANPGGGQTLVFGQLGVLGSTQAPPSLQQQQQQQGSNKPDQVQKYTACAAGTQSASRGGGMQFAPWQFTPQVAWTAGLQPPGATLLAAPNQIFIRSPTQPDMYIQSPQPIQAHNAIAASQQQIQGVQQIAAAGGKPRVMDIQQQQQSQGKQGGSGQRPLSILPSLQGVQGANIRPASSVSTQTVHGVQTTSGKGSGSGGKGRGKPVVRTSPGTNASQGATKADAANQTKSNVHHATMIMQHQPNATNNSGNGSKVLITTNSPVVTSAQPPGSPMSTADKQNFGQQNKTVMQSPQQQQQQVQLPPGIQPQYQQMFMHQMQQLQQYQQSLQSQQTQAQNSQPQLQPKPLMGMTLQPPGQQQGVAPGVVLGAERPIMPVVSMGVGVATTLQMGQVQQPPMSTVQQHPLPALNPALIGNQMVSGTSQVQTMPMLAQSSDVQPSQQSDNNASTPMIVAPERNQQNECFMFVQQCASTPVANEESGASPKKEEEAKETRDSAPNNQEAESNKNTSKEENNSSPAKTEDKLSNNPLVNLANAVNSITNGIVEEPAASINTPISSSKQAPPKALVKPQVLTHVIEGFVIQEASEPFVVNRPTLNGSLNQESGVLNKNNNNNNLSDKDSHDEPPKKKHTASHSNELEANNTTSGKCEACGNTFDEHTTKFKKDKRYCSSICAKSKKKESRDRDTTDKQWTEMEIDPKKSDDLIKKATEDKVQPPLTPTEDINKINPVKWTVNEVCDFIRNLPGCSDYAEDFAIQEIDGQALMLLKEDHLMSAMSIKLGPALKIVAKIDSMRIDNSVTTSPTSNNS
ncbi:polyhomeotic-proximal chromatin protein-like isoform X3 [Chelonus insularis]|uniref:polyhomeotic-proximal chromatin protein-like isoform X3 n=1 Tax=Chelonus insularis TaxID=460826 RepID=UPI00158CEC81|nr:polyhomeotic-proximal chromatin protein-like isoform X3 [Chelonus insularis]